MLGLLISGILVSCTGLAMMIDSGDLAFGEDIYNVGTALYSKVVLPR